MATPVLIIGKSGSGKSTSMRNCQNNRDIANLTQALLNIVRIMKEE